MIKHPRRRRVGALVAAVCAGALIAAPAMASPPRPSFIPDTDGATILMLPGTGDRDGADQIARTAAVGWFGDAVAQGRLRVVDYPAAFGARAFGVLIPVVGRGTYNESAVIGTENLVRAAEETDGKVVLNGFSQSATPVLSAAYLLRQRGIKPEGDIAVIVGADPRFPKTGAEVVMPSFLEGFYTNGERDPAGTGDIPVTSVCLVGDTTCGMANPLARPVSFLVYFAPGFYIHANMYEHVGDYDVVKTTTAGNTTFVVVDGGNPWGMMLRDLGLPVPREFDDVLSAVVPRQMPGEASTVFGHEVPTPRALQVALNNRLGLTTPVTDPDVLGTPGTRPGVTPAQVPLSSPPPADTVGGWRSVPTPPPTVPTISPSVPGISPSVPSFSSTVPTAAAPTGAPAPASPTVTPIAPAPAPISSPGAAAH
ncbi:hypothetical protein [Gordonia sp. (in: high G+C Gram-positive bacteria)]|uniref:hypothetical protein n=1 Tax=Gordonia sp. (in: high G+C Gram-positive bacteria) TaxID=84139 RepID=UPI0039E43EA8